MLDVVDGVKMPGGATRAVCRFRTVKRGTLLGFAGASALMLLSGGCVAPSTMSSGVQYQGRIHADDNIQAIHISKAQEGRPDRGASRIGIGFITFIPVVPYAHQRFTPERYYANAAMMSYDFRDDLAQTAIKDLSAAGLAQTVGYANLSGVNVGASVYRVELTLKEGVWNRNFTTYGLSVMGVYLWIFGLPVSYGHSDMSFEAVMYAPDNTELGRKVFTAQMPLTESMYVAHKFPRQLPKLYEKISPDFRLFVSDCLRRSPASASVPAKVPAPAAALTDGAGSVSGGTAKDYSSRLRALKDSGTITEEEFQQRMLIEAP